MLTRTRQKLAQYRQKSTPIASLADFGLWTLRHGLPPWRIKFWLVVIFFTACLAAVYLTSYDVWAYAAFGSALTLLILTLILTYTRNILKTQSHIHQIEIARMSENLLEMRRDQDLTHWKQMEQIDKKLFEQRKSQTAKDDAFRNTFETTMKDVVSSIEDIQSFSEKKLSDVENKMHLLQVQIDATSKSEAWHSDRNKDVISELSSELSAIKRSVNKKSGNDAYAMEYVLATIEELKIELMDVKRGSSQSSRKKPGQS